MLLLLWLLILLFWVLSCGCYIFVICSVTLNAGASGAVASGAVAVGAVSLSAENAVAIELNFKPYIFSLPYRHLSDNKKIRIVYFLKSSG